jgi:predicted DNA-binding protein with PD1-like motif
MDLRRELEAAIRTESGASAFVVSGIGSLADATLRFAGADSETLVQGAFEILSLAGTITQDGAHMHMAIADSCGRVLGGHVCYGNIVRTTAEALLAQVDDWNLSREFDVDTGFKELVVRRRRER